MQSFKIVLQELFKRIPPTANIYIAMIFIFCYHVLLGKDFACSCQPQQTQCDLYMLVPPLVLTFFILWTDEALKRYWRYFLSTCKTRLCGALLSQTFQGFLVGLLWNASVLIDGDWWVCCKNDQSEQHPQLACKKTNITAEERAIIIELKNQSWIYGLLTCICLSLCASLPSVVASICPKYLKEKWTCCRRQDRLNEVILEQEENLLEEALKNAVKPRLTKDFDGCLDSGRWEKCFYVADNLMDVQTGSKDKNEEIELKDVQAGTSRQQEERRPPPSPPERKPFMPGSSNRQ
ncbi:uncharacterized protein LOC121896030 isoform X2 [Thunnus maccoyii]|uniref:uncharacterized protein LOC121896030 isoform X2 n=1 Tax=Thunnus maccoyii TaxID=8240 RepID=UPI001C4C37BC|nr:uncharacterized protein LOC121896030 isoform X2 [Thunnus maccoyii]